MVSPSMLIVTSKVIKIIVSTSTHFGDKKSKSLKYLEESVLVYTELSWKDLFDSIWEFSDKFEWERESGISSQSLLNHFLTTNL